VKEGFSNSITLGIFFISLEAWLKHIYSLLSDMKKETCFFKTSHTIGETAERETN
jgi:hypothetical protein